MFLRSVKLPKDKSFFLFGPRGVGKSTLLRSLYSLETTFTINLLSAKEESRFSRNPDLLIEVIKDLPPNIKHVVIDEVQKIPKLLDLVHLCLEETRPDIQIIMTGSSARKLKRGQANLLAGRAATRNLFPLTTMELGEGFNLFDYLTWGGLPSIWNAKNTEEKIDYLEAYAQTFLKEEIQLEQIVRKLPPFRRFLEVAAQCNGKIINYLNIARDIGVDPKTVKSYYEILEGTLIGFYLESHHTSRRKRLINSPKFYFFDTGVTRSLAGYLTLPLTPSTSYFGEVFEHMIILELFRKSQYQRLNYRFTFLRTEDHAEIDLVIERPGKPLAMVEIKSKEEINPEDLRHLRRFDADFPEAQLFCLSRDRIPRALGRIQCLPWQQGLAEI